MATLSSSTHCRSSSNALYALSSSSSSVNAQHQHIAFSSSPLSAKLSFQCRRNSHSIMVLMQGAVVSTPTCVENEIPLKESKVGLMSGSSLDESNDLAGFDTNGDESTISITIVGASGDLAKKKIFPALFALYYEGCLPEHFTIYGYARSKMTDADLRNMVSRTLTCRIDKRENCDEKMDEFLKRCFYHSGQYDSQENFAALDKKLKEHEVIRTSPEHRYGIRHSLDRWSISW